MKEVFIVIAFLVIYIIGIAVGSSVVSDGPRFVETLGTTYPELSSMKEECEHPLPRNQHCFASIIFIPTASEEQL